VALFSESWVRRRGALVMSFLEQVAGGSDRKVLVTVVIRQRDAV
jgi:hypothetical protein